MQLRAIHSWVFQASEMLRYCGDRHLIHGYPPKFQDMAVLCPVALHGADTGQAIALKHWMFFYRPGSSDIGTPAGMSQLDAQEAIM